RARRIALAGVAVALAVAAGAWVVYKSNLDQEKRLDNAVAALNENQGRAASQSIGPDVRRRLVQAAYLVTIKRANGREVAVASASPIASDLLGTNAHVVAAFEELGSGEKMFVHPPGVNGRAYEVKDAKKHPAYDAFKRFLNDNPLYVDPSD